MSFFEVNSNISDFVTRGYFKDDNCTMEALKISACSYFETVKDFLLDNNIPILKKIYASKYNQYITYDYRPLNIEGFDLYLQLDFTSNATNFVVQLLSNHFKTIEKLETLLEC